MSFLEQFDALPMKALMSEAREATTQTAQSVLSQSRLSLMDFARLLSPGAAPLLETMCRRSHALTLQRFGKVMRLFAPLYLSNECINNCQYCGFSRDNPILRVTLSGDDVTREARAIHAQGFRNILLVAGEHPKFVSMPYLTDCIRRAAAEVPSVSLEIGPLETADYRTLVESGAEGLVIYQETYDRELYSRLHTAGPKRDFNWRLQTPERGSAAGFRRIGLGALYGLADWRYESICVAAHAQYLLRHAWQSYVTISLPRLRPCAGEFNPLTTMTDREMVQLVCAFRIMFPDVGLVLSTRESPRLRDGLIPLGITLMSAGSHTEPGGYTGAGKDDLHRTERGHRRELNRAGGEQADSATMQFAIADERSADEVARRLRDLGYEPVWKDWDAALTT